MERELVVNGTILRVDIGEEINALLANGYEIVGMYKEIDISPDHPPSERVPDPNGSIKFVIDFRREDAREYVAKGWTYAPFPIKEVVGKQ